MFRPNPNEQLDFTVTDPCEAAYSQVIDDIYSKVNGAKERERISFEELVLMPVISAAQDIEESTTERLTKPEKHRLRAQVIFDVMHRLQNAGELEAQDSISWRQTDNPGEEWVEYTNGSGEVFALNCLGLKYGFGKIEQNKKRKKYAALYERSYEYENDYDVVKRIIGSNERREPSRKTFAKRALGRIGLAGAMTALSLTGLFVATAAQDALADPQKTEQTVDKRKQLEHVVDTTQATPTAHETVSSMVEQPETRDKLLIEPRKHFLNPDGSLTTPDYKLMLPAIGSTIYGFERPAGEGADVGKSVNATVIDTLTEAQTPQGITRQVAEYARNNPGFIPTAERTGKPYWNGNTASAFQKTAMHEHKLSVYPGQDGNAYFLAHGSTKNAGGGDLPALKAGDALTMERSIDGNTYTYMYVGKEVINVDKNGALTGAEREIQMAKGFGENVTFRDVAYNYSHPDTRYKGYATIQICSDSDGVPGGVNGVGAAEARTLLRFIRIDANQKVVYTNS